MAALIVIPARYASTRYLGKPRVGLRGAGGEARSLIRRTWDAAMQVGGAVLAQDATSPALRDRERAASMLNASTVTSGAHGLRPFRPELIHRVSS